MRALPCVVATSSLELGIDMGAVDLVVQVEAPPSVASGCSGSGAPATRSAPCRGRGVPEVPGRSRVLRRGGRADGRRARSSRCATRATRSTSSPSSRRDDRRWSRGRSTTSRALVRRAAPVRRRCRTRRCSSVLDMLAGRYPSRGVRRAAAAHHVGPRHRQPGRAPRRAAPRRHLRRHDPRPRAVHGDDARRGRGRRRRVAGRRARRGDGLRVPGRRHVPARHVELARRRHHARPRDRHARARACPRGCRSGRASRSAARSSWAGRSGRSCGRCRGRRRGGRARARRGGRARRSGPSTTCSPTCTSSASATRHVPSDRTIVVERFRDELGDWRLVVHSPFGAQVNGAVGARDRRADARDGAGWRCPARRRATTASCCGCPTPSTTPAPRSCPPRRTCCSTRTRSSRSSSAELGGSSLYASRFRECAARSLLLPRRDPTRRTPLWQQRQKAAQLLAVAGRYEQFPVTLEAMRECVQDVYDLPGPRAS